MGIIRLLLALLVVNSHVAAPVPGTLSGNDAVQIFFAISGFYMALVLDGGYPQVGRFWRNRFLRLWPCYAVTVLATCLWAGGPWRALAALPWWHAGWIALVNIAMVGIDLPAAFTWAPGTGLSLLRLGPDGGALWTGGLAVVEQAWSIGNECWFYLAAPFLLRRSAVEIAAVAGFSLLFRLWATGQGLNPYYLFPANLWLFLVGTLLYRARGGFAPLVRFWPLVLALACAAALLGGRLPGGKAVCLLGVMAAIPVVFEGTRRDGWDAALAQLSYPVYLVHLLAISVLAAFGVAGVWPAMLASVAVAAIMARTIEVPIARWYRQGTRPVRLRAVPA